MLTQDPKPNILRPAHRRVPPFVLPSASGGTYGPGALRSKYNMVMLFLGEGAPAEHYLREVVTAYPAILEEQARVIAVTTSTLDDARTLRDRLSLPFHLLADTGGALTGRMLGSPDLAALCVVDRYAEIYSLDLAASPAELPTTRAALEWLQFIQVQCPE